MAKIGKGERYEREIRSIAAQALETDKRFGCDSTFTQVVMDDIVHSVEKIFLNRLIKKYESTIRGMKQVGMEPRPLTMKGLKICNDRLATLVAVSKK